MWSIEAQEELWNKAGGMTPSAASARVLKGGELESTPPIIARLCNSYLQCHDLGSYYSISTL